MNDKKAHSRAKHSTTVNWQEIRSRMEIAEATIERGVTLTPEEKKKILRARSKELAREPERQAPREEHLEVVEFLLSYERYGVESSYVREIVPMKELTPLPCTPSFVLGIINVRGQILSVIDIKKFFELPEKGLTDLNKVIIVHNGDMEFGILADVILGVQSMPLQDIQPPLPTLTGIRAEYLKGVTRERAVILDAGKILSDPGIIVQEKVRT